MRDHTRHSPRQLQLLRHAERRLASTPVGEIGTGADPSRTVAIGSEKRNRAHQAPFFNPVYTRTKSQLRFESNSASHCGLPRLSALRFFFRHEPNRLKPSSPLTETLVEPRVVHVGELPIVARRPYRAWQRLSKLLES